MQKSEMYNYPSLSPARLACCHMPCAYTRPHVCRPCGCTHRNTTQPITPAAEARKTMRRFNPAWDESHLHNRTQR